MRRAMAGRQGGRNDERRDLSGVLEGMPRSPRLDNDRARAVSLRQLLRRPRPRLLRQRRRNRAHCSGGNSLQRQPRPLRAQPTARRLQPEPVNSPQCRKLNTAAPERRWFGSTSARTFATLRELTITATRSRAPTCARPTSRLPAIARRRTTAIRKEESEPQMRRRALDVRSESQLSRTRLRRIGWRRRNRPSTLSCLAWEEKKETQP